VPVDYYFRRGSATREWTLDVEVYAPDGSPVGASHEWGSGRTAEGGTSAEVCANIPGTYRVKATVEWFDDRFSSLGTESAISPFEMSYPRTATTMFVSRRKPRPQQRVRFITSSRVENGISWVSNVRAYVALEVRTVRGWQRVRGSTKLTDSDGMSSWTYRWTSKRPITYRAVTVGGKYLASESAARTVG
jgi:hypothetical protein